MCVDVEMERHDRSGTVRDPEANVEDNKSVSEKRITRRAGQALRLLQSIFNPHIPAGHVCFHMYSYSGI